MKYRRSLALFLIAGCSVAAAGKDKKQIVLPTDVLEARTVLVVVDPESGVAVDDPLANRRAQEDVEKALMKWGRFTLALDASDADLVISVRKGNGKIAQPTVGGTPTNNRPVIFEPSDSGIRVGGRKGNSPVDGDPTNAQPQRPMAQVEAGQPEDTFKLFRGKREDATEWPPVWRYSAKDALRSPGVPAVDEFRKVIVEAEKQQAAKP